MEAQDLDGARGLSLGPGVLSLDEDPFGHELIPISPKNVGITAHLASPFPGDGCDGRHRCNLITLEGFQLQVFPTTNDVATVDVASSAMLFEQQSAGAGVRPGCKRCSGRSKAQQQKKKRANAAAQDLAQHRDGVVLISLLEQVMLPFGTAGSVRRESGSPAEAKCATC